MVCVLGRTGPTSAPTTQEHGHFEAICPSPPKPEPPEHGDSGSGDDTQDALLATDGEWAGTVTFVDAALNTTDAPLNLTVTGRNASMSWTFFVDAVGRQCRVQNQAVLRWTVTARGVATAEPTTSESTYFAFRGSVDNAASTISGLVYSPLYTETKPVGCFTVRRVDAGGETARRL